MKVEILGAGCPRCEQTYKTILNAAAEVGLAADITYVTDLAVIAQRGVMVTPAVVIDGKTVLSGRVPSPRQAKDLLQGKSGK
jgi:small redox-active disulfide protein 2